MENVDHTTSECESVKMVQDFRPFLWQILTINHRVKSSLSIANSEFKQSIL